MPLLSKTLTVGRAICLLVDGGFAAEAFATSRTLIEIFLTVRYITNKDTEKRAERYVKYHARVRVEWKKIIEEHMPLTAKGLKAIDPDVIEKAREFKSRGHWAEEGVRAKMMAVEEDTRETDKEGKGINSKFDYDALYFWTSQYVHATVDGIGGHACGPGEIFRIRARYADEKDLGNSALFNTAVFTCKIFVHALRCMNEVQPRALDDLFKMIRKVARADAARSLRSV